MKRKAKRLTDHLLEGAADYACGNDQLNRPAGGQAEQAYLDGWIAAAKDDLHRRCLASGRTVTA